MVIDGAVGGDKSRMLIQGRWRREMLFALFFASFAFLIYNANWRLISSGDNYPARYLPFAILKHHTLTLDPVADMVAQRHPFPYWMVESEGHLFSRYPITVPILVTPLYLPAFAFLQWQGWSEERLEKTARLMEKLTASLIASMSVGLMFLLLVRRTSCRWPVLLTFAYAFGTNTWMISSQALWQHGMAQLLIALALFLVLGSGSSVRVLVLGCCLALIAAVRPPDAIIATALGVFALRWARGKVWLLFAGAAIPMLLLLTYNYRVAHDFAGAYAMPWNGKEGLDSFRYSMLGGIAGLLFSPARGLFFFSPFLLFLPLGVRYTLQAPRDRVLALLLLGAVIVQIVLYARLDWRAGSAWGPRWLTDVLPLLIWMLAAGMGRLSRIGITVFVLAMGISIGAQTVGAFWYTGASDAEILQPRGDPNAMPALWNPDKTPFLAELRRDPAPRELLLDVKGSVDRVSADGCPVEQIIPGTDLMIEGWTLTDLHTPLCVEVTLIPPVQNRWQFSRSYPVAGTSTFFDRPDVSLAVQGKGPAGWRVVVKTDGLEAGPHMIEVRAQGNAGGEGHFVTRRPILILPDELDSSARIATERLRNRQDPGGYWLTAHTKTPQFENPRLEMNLFVTAIIHDLLEPVAGAAGFEENLARARRHLLAQIESNGLVRYHGRPDSPTIPTLGVTITPDSDDTALAWRMADSKEDARLQNALDIMKTYRDESGLYRTWLAPREEYLSIDPGQDPNPPDIGIQMHVLMWLADADPAAAKELHKALQSAIGEDRFWVYYKKAPLIQIWRAAELKNMGYPITVPPSRWQTITPGQEIWLRACQQLELYTEQGDQRTRRPAPEETRELLKVLKQNNFAAIRSNPPLLYHNDLTARVSRYYWSEDFGYALWLRLNFELAASSPQNGVEGLKP